MHSTRTLRSLTLLSSLAAAAAITALPLAASPAVATTKAAVANNHRTIAITATDFLLHLHVTGPIAAGRVEIDLHNEGTMPHQATILALHPGVTVTAFKALIAKAGDGAALALATPVGGPGTIDPGGSQTTWQLLAPGNYLAVCFVQGPDGRSHLDRGMLTPFTVAGPMPAPGQVGAALFPVRPLHTITAHDMTFSLPQHFSGNGTYKFIDTDKADVHELAFLKLAPGKHKADFLAWFRKAGGHPSRTPAGSPGRPRTAALDWSSCTWHRATTSSPASCLTTWPPPAPRADGHGARVHRPCAGQAHELTRMGHRRGQ